jgi:hypothetical protein
MDMDYTAFWHLPRLYNPANFDDEKEDIFPGIISVNILCLPNETKPGVPGMRRVMAPGDSWRG